MTTEEKIEEILSFFKENNINEYKQGVVITLREYSVTIRFPRGKSTEKVAMLRSGGNWAIVHEFFDLVYSNIFESYNPHFPIKRDNWTTQEIVDMMDDHDLDYLYERFYDMSRPVEEFGAFAYQPRTKSFVHIGTPPGKIKIEKK